MKFRITIAFWFLYLSFPQTNYSQLSDSVIAKNVIISTSLFGYIPGELNEANYNFDVEIYLKNRKSVALNFGLIKSYGPSGGLFQISSKKTTGFKIQVDGKYYLNKHQIFEPILVILWPMLFQFNSLKLDNTGYYVAINSFIQNTETDRSETILNYTKNLPHPNFSYYIDNTYSVNRKAFGLNIKFGYMCIKHSGLSIDFALGAGIQYITSISENRKGSNLDWPNSEKEMFTNKLFDSGSGFYPNIVAEFKLGWGL